MLNKMVYCEECREEKPYTVSEVKKKGILKGQEYEYRGKIAHCNDCGEEVYVEEINDYNLKALYDRYRIENKIISLEQITEIPEKYNIGKRPLSLLFGWGEQTYSRYLEGDLPSKQYSDFLQKIFDEPSYFAQVLEENRQSISQTTYNKCKKAIDLLLGVVRDSQSEQSKLDLAIEYLRYICDEITPLALQKALYYVQGFYYAFYKQYVFNENCQAWVHGPVFPEIYQRYSNYGCNPMGYDEGFDESMLNALEKEILDNVANNICCYSGKVLERFTHSETPWIITRGDLPMDTPSSREISKTLIGEYFTSVKEKYNMIKPADIKAYARDMFLDFAR